MFEFIALSIGAILGVSLRSLALKLPLIIFELHFSLIIVNLLGSFLAGIFFNKLSGNSYIFIIIGFLGSLTTLSGFNSEFFLLLKNSLYFKAMMYFILTIICSFTLFLLGYLIAN